ncbi:MAG: class I SAM-dependent methyltransferase [Burkholderiales bacterium]
MPGDNDVIIEAWNTVLFDKFTRFKHLLIDGLAAHSREALQRTGYRNGMRVLDIGCGFGDSTRHIARLVGPAGSATGIDCAPRFVESARAEAAADGVPNAEFVVADAQTDDLRGPYDAAFSRFGTMFFNLPGAAFRNVRKSLQPGAELFMIAWRRREENPWLHDAELCVRELVPVVSHEDTDQVHCGPGPFSMAGPDMVSGLLGSAGYTRIAFERFDADICIGRDLDEAIEFAMALGPAGEIMRLAGDEAEKRKPEVVEALRKTLGKYVRNDGVWGPSSTWFVRARNS